MNLVEKEERLKDILEHNIKNEKIGTAIAITGPWGVGKTFFWKRFIDGCNFKKKYVYVSLFGLESLSDLKTHIYSNIENNHSNLEIPRWIRGLPSILKDTRVSQFGLSASTKIFDSLMFNQVKDAIICFDDFERMSKKLEIKDVMGLANYLKLEKNCQIILILDEDKAEGDNKKKYAEYKEKLVDETIIVNSVEPLIRENTKDIDDQLIDLMIEFANKLEIHNFRFFQKVIKLYREFKDSLPPAIADSTKKIILVRILQGFFILDFGAKYEVTWEDFTIKSSVRNLINEKYHPEKAKSESLVLDKLEKVSYLFVTDDLWSIEFRKWFDQRDSINFFELNRVANLELISEQNNKNKNDLYDLMKIWRNLEVNESYCEQIFSLSKALVGVEILENLYFYSDLLKKFGRHDLSRALNLIVKENLKDSLNLDVIGTINQAFDSGFNKKNLFHRYLKYWQYHNHDLVLPSLFNVMSNYLLSKSWNDSDAVILKNATKNDWEDLIWNKIPNDPRFFQTHKMSLIKKIFEQRIDSSLTPQIKSMIFEVLEEKAFNGDIYLRKNIEFLITILKEN